MPLNSVVPDSVTSIGESAFTWCVNLTSVNYTGTIDQWVQIEFSGSLSNPLYYAGNLYINNQLVTTANITSATKINAYAFAGSNLTSINIPDAVTSIGEGAFHHCFYLTNVIIPDSVTLIADSLFHSSLLTSINIHNSVTSIGAVAFASCRKLTSVIIGNCVNSIGLGAFEGCISLTKVYYVGSATEWNSISIHNYGNSCLINAALYYYSESKPTDSGNYWHYDSYGNVVEW